VERYHIKAVALDLPSFVVCGAELGGALRSPSPGWRQDREPQPRVSGSDDVRSCAWGLRNLGGATRRYLGFYRFVVLALPVLQLAQ